MIRVLVVDDEPHIRRALAITLRARDYEVVLAGNGAGALSAAAATPPDLVVLDLGLPDLDGVEVIRGLRGWTDAPAPPARRWRRPPPPAAPPARAGGRPGSLPVRSAREMVAFARFDACFI